MWLCGLLPATARERQRSAGVRDAWAPPNPRSQKPAARTVGFLIAAVGAVIGAMAGVFCGIVACDPLPEVVTAGFAYSWCVVLFLPAVAVGLCVARAPKAFPGISAAAFPAIAVPAAFGNWYAGSGSDESPAEHSNSAWPWSRWGAGRGDGGDPEVPLEGGAGNSTRQQVRYGPWRPQAVLTSIR